MADTLIALIIATVMTIYVILAWVFSSYTTPFIVMSIIPFGFVGAMFGHWIMGFHVNMTSLQALLGLAGVMINDAIILVSSVKRRMADGTELTDGDRQRRTGTTAAGDPDDTDNDRRTDAAVI